MQKLLISILMSFGLSGPALAADTARPNDDAAIAQAREKSTAAWNAHDAHAFAAGFAPDADFTNIVGNHAHGRDNIEAFHAPMFLSFFKDTHVTSTVRSIRYLAPDLAMMDADWQMTGARMPDGTPNPSRKGLLDCVMQRQADGSWLILVMHNAEFPARPPASAPPPKP